MLFPSMSLPKPPNMFNSSRFVLLILFALHVQATFFINFEKLNTSITAARESNSTSAPQEYVDIFGNPTSKKGDQVGIRVHELQRIITREAYDSWMLLSWDVFPFEILSWLWPWFGLIPQIPLSSETLSTAMMGLCLVLGSPGLAGYSLARTVLSARSIDNQFNNVSKRLRRMDPRRGDSDLTSVRARAVKRTKLRRLINPVRAILIETQHVPIALSDCTPEQLRISLQSVHNLHHWEDLEMDINSTKIRKTFGLVWVMIAAVIAQVLGLAVFYITGRKNSNIMIGIAINFLWSWLIPVVWGWMVVGTQNSADTVNNALLRMSKRSPHGTCIFQDQAYIADVTPKSHDNQSLEGWTKTSGAPSAFARISAHEIVVADVYSTIVNIAHDLEHKQVAIERKGTFADDPESRSTICTRYPYSRVGLIRSLMLGMLLQWGSTGSAIWIAYKTPVVGLGCASGFYLFYGSLATIVFALQIIAAELSHRWNRICASNAQSLYTWNCIGAWATYACTLGNILAVVNATWVILISFLQFTNVYENFWCACTALQSGGRITKESWVLILASPNQIYAAAWKPWAGGTTFGIASSIACLLFFIFTYKNKKLSIENEEYHYDDLEEPLALQALTTRSSEHTFVQEDPEDTPLLREHREHIPLREIRQRGSIAQV